MLTRNDLLRSQFKTIEDYFNHCRDLARDGHISEAREMVEKLSDKQRRKLYFHLRTPFNYSSHLVVMDMVIDLL